MNKPTHRAFGTRGATDGIGVAAAAPRLVLKLKEPRLSLKTIGLIIKCAVGLWVIAILYVAFRSPGDAFF
jgi:hypothetical protein